MPISGEQLCTTLENMAKMWEQIPFEERPSRDREISLFDDSLSICKEMIGR